MIGTLVNVAAIVAGGAAGLILKKGIKERYKTTIMQAIGLGHIGWPVAIISSGKTACD